MCRQSARVCVWVCFSFKTAGTILEQRDPNWVRIRDGISFLALYPTQKFFRNQRNMLTCSTFSTMHFFQRWATGWTIGILGFDPRRGLGIFLFTTASRTALGPTQTPIQWVPGGLSLEVKRPGREANHSRPSSAEVEERVELYLHSPNTSPWRGAQLKHRDNFTFTFT
jgi:hypothetical protein